MTKEELIQLLPTIEAYIDGKTIQTKLKTEWIDVTDPDFGVPGCFRVKPECRPFKNAEECWKEMRKHQPFGWVKSQGQYRLIVRITEDIFQLDKADEVCSFKEGFRYCQFADGTIFGIEE